MGERRLELKCDFLPEDGSVDYDVHTAIEFVEELFPILLGFPSFISIILVILTVL